MATCDSCRSVDKTIYPSICCNQNHVLCTDCMTIPTQQSDDLEEPESSGKEDYCCECGEVHSDNEESSDSEELSAGDAKVGDETLCIQCPLCPDEPHIVMYRDKWDTIPKPVISPVLIPGIPIQDTVCPQHQQPLDKYCIKCDIVVCSECNCLKDHVKYTHKPSDIPDVTLDLKVDTIHDEVIDEHEEKIQSLRQQLENYWNVEKAKHDVVVDGIEKLRQQLADIQARFREYKEQCLEKEKTTIYMPAESCLRFAANANNLRKIALTNRKEKAELVRVVSEIKSNMTLLECQTYLSDVFSKIDERNRSVLQDENKLKDAVDKVTNDYVNVFIRPCQRFTHQMSLKPTQDYMEYIDYLDLFNNLRIKIDVPLSRRSFRIVSEISLPDGDTIARYSTGNYGAVCGEKYNRIYQFKDDGDNLTLERTVTCDTKPIHVSTYHKNGKPTDMYLISCSGVDDRPTLRCINKLPPHNVQSIPDDIKSVDAATGLWDDYIGTSRGVWTHSGQYCDIGDTPRAVFSRSDGAEIILSRNSMKLY